MPRISARTASGFQAPIIFFNIGKHYTAARRGKINASLSTDFTDPRTPTHLRRGQVCAVGKCFTDYRNRMKKVDEGKMKQERRGMESGK